MSTSSTERGRPNLESDMISDRSNDRLAVVARLLGYAVALVLITAMAGLLYFLVIGVLNPPAPRTSLEARFMVLDKALKDQQERGDLWADFIAVNTVMGRESGANKAYEDASIVLAESPDQLQKVELAWAEALVVRGEYEDALEQVVRVLEMDAEALAVMSEQQPQVASMGLLETGAAPRAYAVQGNALIALERWSEAVEAYTKVLESSPEDAGILVARGAAYLRSGDRDAARGDFNEALRFVPSDESALRFLDEMGEE